MKPLPIPKYKHCIALAKKTHATALDLRMGYYTIKIGSRHIQSLYHHCFLGADLLQELTVKMPGSPDITIVAANGIPRGCMSSPR
jgi:hypothetical protein